jgi:hypothetical protein
MRRIGSLIFIIVFAVGKPFVSNALATAAGGLQTIALSGEAAPGAPSSRTFEGFTDVVINDHGEAAFVATLNGAQPPYFGEGIWTWQAGSGLHAEAVVGTIAPSSGSRTFSTIFGPVLNNNGDVAFRATTKSGSSLIDGLWTNSGGGVLKQVMMNGALATPAGAGWRFSEINPTSNYQYPAMNDSGRVAFAAFLTSSLPGVNPIHSVWEWTSAGGLQLAARAGNSPTGVTDGAYLVQTTSPSINSAGTTAYIGYLDGPGVTPATGDSIVKSVAPGSAALFARNGDSAPGVPGATLQNVDSPLINDAGHTFFRAQLSTVPSVYHHGIWSDRSGSLAKLHAYGEHPPGVPADGKFNSFAAGFAVNNQDRLAFVGYFDASDVSGGFNEGGIFSEGRTGALELIAREGSQAPGLPLGKYFRDFGAVALNDRGQTVFRGYVGGPSASDPNFFAIFAQDVDGQVKLVAAEGQTIDVDDGPGIDMRQIVGVGFYERSGDPTYAGGINNLGQISFAAYFADGSSGAFVTNVVAVPEPTSASLLCLIGVVAGFRRGAKSQREYHQCISE